MEPDTDFTQTRYLSNEEATLTLGAEMSGVLEKPALVFLEGDLGAGKTTLSRGLLRGLGHEGGVKSPTYTLVEPYTLDAVTVFHFDLYRLSDGAELAYLGLDDYFATPSILLVEWPERGAGWLGRPDWRVTLSPDGEGRRVTLRAMSPRGRDWLNRLEQRSNRDG